MTETRMAFDQGEWLNPPPAAVVSPDHLQVETAAGSDFWCETHYGFTRTTGHALLFDMPGRFAAELTFAGRFSGTYEQAGLLLWDGPEHWIKAGIEYADGRANLAVVVTRGRSDWSMTPLEGSWRSDDDATLRLAMTDTAVLVHARIEDRWQILRVADFEASAPRLGPMACSPKTSGLSVAFRDFRLVPLPADPLYLGAVSPD